MIAGNGERVPNERVVVNSEADRAGVETNQPTSVLQVADMMRLLMSVLHICGQGSPRVFNDAHALVLNSEGRTLCKFERLSSLNVAKLKLRQPELSSRPS